MVGQSKIVLDYYIDELLREALQKVAGVCGQKISLVYYNDPNTHRPARYSSTFSSGFSASTRSR
jgi:hypothetical protein